MVKKLISKLFVETIPSILGRVLTEHLLGESLQKNWQKKEQRVYDIVNVGMKHQFVVASNLGGLISHNCVQSTGHDILVMWVSIITRMLNDERISWKPIICDYHDEIIGEFPEEQAERGLAIIGCESFKELNYVLGGTIPLKGEGKIVRNLAEAKCK